MANAGRKGVIEYEETFAIDTIGTSAADGLAWLNSSDGGDTAFVRSLAAARGLHVAGATAATDDNLIEFCSDQLIFYGQTGESVAWVLFQLDSVANVAFNFGFNDDVLDASNTLPVELSTTTFTANAATFLGMVYDVDATNDNVHCFWVDGGTATTTAIADLRMKGATPVVDKWAYMEVSMQDRGSGNGVRATFLFVQDGKSFEKTFNTTITRSTGLCWYLGVENRSASVHNARIKLPGWRQTIAD